MDILKKLEDVNIPTSRIESKRANTFLMRIEKGKICIRPGDAKITVRTSKRKRQALITVVEPPRSFHRVVRMYPNVSGFSSYGEIGQLNSKQLKDLAEKSLPLRMNRIADYVRSQIPFVPNSKLRITKYSFTYPYICIHAKHIAPQTTTTFLVGFDESESTVPFICVLKENVTTFADAYESLKPQNVNLKTGYKRQGEWFFNPVSKKLSRELTENINKACSVRLNHTSHMAHVLVLNRQQYAIGPVKDTRKGRHKTLMLYDWHSVHRNNEHIVQSKTYD